MKDNSQNRSRRRPAAKDEIPKSADHGAADGEKRRRDGCSQAAATHRNLNEGGVGEQSPETATQAATSGGARKAGYRSPPKCGQFKPGQSGNPRGRPKGSRNRNRNVLGDTLMATLLAEAERRVSDPAGGTEQLPVRQAMVRSLFDGAVRGRLVRVALDVLNRAEVETRKRQCEVIARFEDYQREARDAIADCAARGVPPPDLYPHPDEIFISQDAGTVIILGELSAFQKMKLTESLWTARDEPAAEVAALRALLETETFAPYRDMVLDEIKAEQRIVDHCNRMLFFLKRPRPKANDAAPEVDAEEAAEQEPTVEPSAAPRRRVRPKS